MTESLIRHLEELSKVGLDEDERETLRKSLQKILDYMKTLDEVDVSGIKPMYTPVETTTPMRKDEVREFPAEEIKENFPEKEKDHVKVPPIIG